MSNRLNSHFVKSSGFLAPGAAAAGRAILAGAGKVFNSFVVNNSGLKWLLKNLSKGAKGNGTYNTATGALKTFTPNPYAGTHWWEGFRHGVGNLAGRSWNKINELERYTNYNYAKGLRDFESRYGVGARKALNRTLKGLGYAGVGGGFAEMPFQVVDGGEDTTAYKILHGANMINPVYHLAMSEYSPANIAFNYATPLGLAFTGANKLYEGVTNSVVDAGKMGAMTAVDQTANQLGNLSFADRLGFLLSPRTAAEQYRQQGFDAIARQMAQIKGTGDPIKDKAIAEINSVSN